MPEAATTEMLPHRLPESTTAASARQAEGALARKFVATLLDVAGRRLRESAETTIGFLPDDFDVDDGEDHDDPKAPAIVLSVDEAAAAVLVATPLEADPGLLRSLRRESPIVVFQVPDEALQDPVRRVLRSCVFGRAANIVSTSELDALRLSPAMFERRSIVLLDCDTDKRGASVLKARAVTALSLDVPICAFALDVVRSVPEPVRALSDKTIVLGGWSASAIAVLLEATTGESVPMVEEPWQRSVTLDDLRMAVSSQRGGSASLARLRTCVLRRTATENETPLLQDLSGYGEARRIGLEMIEDLLSYRDGRIGWREVGRGLVLSGPPGTGKTHFAKAFARSAGLPLVVGSLAAWQASGDGHLGDCLGAMRRTFAEARAAAPAVLLVDELDSFGDRASFNHRHRDYSSQVVNAFLQELDGAVDRDGVVVLGATNLPDRIDPAILRSGRLDRLVEIGLPEANELAGILRTLLGRDLPEADLLPAALAGRGGTGADAAGWVRRARGAARREGRELTADDVLNAVQDGRETLQGADRMRVALHEAAHACSAIVLDVGKVVDMHIHSTGGTTCIAPGRSSTTRLTAIASMVHCLSGRAVERLVLGAASAGSGGDAGSDLARATGIAFAMENSWGLGDTGAVWLSEATGDVSNERTLAYTFPAVLRLLGHAEIEAARLVATYRADIVRCAEALWSTGYLDASAITKVLGDLAPFPVRDAPVHRGGQSRREGAGPQGEDAYTMDDVSL